VPRAPSSERFVDWRPDQRLSWMVQLLPYFADGAFSGLPIENDKSWNESGNLLAATTVIPQFLAPLPPDKPFSYYVQYPGLKGPPLAATHFVGIAGVGLDAPEYRADDAAKAKLRGIFGYDRETKPDEIKDGLEQTILLIQVPSQPKSPWIAGGGSTVRGVSTDSDCVQPFVCAEHEGKRGTFAIMADGKVRFIPATIDPKTFQAMCTIAGGDKIKDIDAVAPEVSSDEELKQPELKTEPPAPKQPPVTPPPPPQGADSEGAISVTAEELSTAYLKDRDAADKKYKGKLLAIQGAVYMSWISHPDFSIDLKGSPIPGGVQLVVCYLRKDLQGKIKEDAATKGQSMRLKGRCQGLDHIERIILKDCAITAGAAAGK
jgi:hypothetical protein